MVNLLMIYFSLQRIRLTRWVNSFPKLTIKTMEQYLKGNFLVCSLLTMNRCLSNGNMLVAFPV